MAFHSRRPPLAPPSPPISPSAGSPNKDLFDFFAPMQAGGAEATPPPSLPTSPPGSPEALKGKGRKLEEPKGKSKKSRLGGGTEKERVRVDTDTEAFRGAQEDDPTSPILPKVKLAFPTIMSDEEDEGLWSSGPRSANGGSQAGGGSTASSTPRSRTWSKTTTTRKTEHRSFRYSMPAFEHLYDDDTTNSSGTSSPGTRGTSTPRHSPSLSTSSVPQNTSSRRPIHSTSSFSNARPTRTSLPSRRPATSFGSSSSASNRFDKLFDSSPLPSRHYNSTDPYSMGEPPLQPLRDPPPLVTTLTTTTLPFVKPFVNLFFLLVISAIAACSISAVLVTGFGLTFVDDCGRRVQSLRAGFGAGQKRMKGSIEGVRAGVGRILGGARGALDLAVWAAGAKRLTPRARARFEDSDPATEEATGGDDSLKGKGFGRGRSRRRRNSCSPGVAKRFGSGEASSSRFPTSSSVNQEGWTSDEEAYTVPPPTPRTTPATPARSPSPASTRSLPPRPPLRTLIPSLLFVLAYTFYKVVFALWTGRTEPPKPRRRP